MPKKLSLQIEKEAKKIELKYVIFRKVGILSLTLIFISALLGLVGGEGFLRRKVIQNHSKTFQVEYHPFLREFFSALLKITIYPQPNQNKVILWGSQNYFNRFYIKQILPSPNLIKVAGDKIGFEFSLISNQSNAPMIISFLLEPQGFGRVMETFSLDQERLSFKQFIYP